VKPDETSANRYLQRTKLTIDANHNGFAVPQSMRNRVNTPPDENLRVPYEADGGKTPSGTDNDVSGDLIPV
jgi:hypothetical protein